MAFDINEARAIIEAAKQRGAIRDANSAPAATPASSPKPSNETSGDVVIPDWLQEGIRLGPLARTDSDSDRQ
jgi:hypothetical protein